MPQSILSGIAARAVNVTTPIPTRLLQAVDEAAIRQTLSRAAFVRSTLEAELRRLGDWPIRHPGAEADDR